MCYRNLPSHRTGEYKMDFMSLFCELGNKPPIPAYPISLPFASLRLMNCGF